MGIEEAVKGYVGNSEKAARQNATFRLVYGEELPARRDEPQPR